MAASGDEKAVKDFVASIQVDMNADLPEFLLTGRSAACTKFAKAYNRFWHDLVEAGSESALMDDFLVPRLMLFYSEFMQSHLRPLRYAAVSASFALCMALLAQIESTTADLKRREKQLKSTASMSKAAVSRLHEDVEEVKRRLSVYESAVNDVWGKVFKRSWNDRDPSIRVLAIKSYGAWCIKLPRVFSEDVKFRFLVWMMADPQAEVRQATGEVLCKLLSAEPLRPTLKGYCSAIANRVLAFTRDQNDKVAIVGVQIATLLRQHFGREYLDKDMVDEISLLLSSDVPALRHVAGSFALPDIIANAEDYITGASMDDDGGEEDAGDEGSSKRRKKSAKKSASVAKNKKKGSDTNDSATKAATQVKGAAQAQLLALLDYIPEATVHHELPGVVIDAIWKPEQDYFLFQFEDMAKLMTATGANQLEDAKFALLAEVLLSVVRNVEEHSSSRSSSKGFSAAQLRKQFTLVFHTLLPSLLASHKAEDALLPALLSHVNFFDLAHLGSLKSDGTRNVRLTTHTFPQPFHTARIHGAPHVP